MISITFLGTVSGIPTRDRNHPAIIVEYSGERKSTLLWDCGEGTQRQLLIAGISIMDIDKIFITHWHADHFAGLIPLIQTMNLEKRTKELKIYGPEAERFVSDIIDMGYFGLRFPVEAINVPFEGDEITKIDSDDEYDIFSIPVMHTVPSVAYCIKEADRWNLDVAKMKRKKMRPGAWLKTLKSEGTATYGGKKVKLEDLAKVTVGKKVVYTGDTMPCDTVVKISESADLLIHDGTFLESDEVKGKHHADISGAIDIAKKAKVKELVLTHFSRRYNNVKEIEKIAKKKFKHVKAAHDFMKVEIK